MKGCLERGGSRGILEEELMKEEFWVMWIVFALLSAVFAALTSILAKIGIDGVNSNLATAVRKLSIVFTLVLAFFFLHDTFTVKSLIGCALIAIGTIIMVWK